MEDILTGIYTILLPLKAQGKVAEIYKYSQNQALGYPYIEIIPKSHEQKYFTNNENLIEYKFDILIYQERSEDNIGAVTARNITSKIFDDILALIKTEQLSATPLNNSCDFIRPIFSIEEQQFAEINQYVVGITLTAVKTL
jgi:hypothetical protein